MHDTQLLGIPLGWNAAANHGDFPSRVSERYARSRRARDAPKGFRLRSSRCSWSIERRRRRPCATMISGCLSPGPRRSSSTVVTPSRGIPTSCLGAALASCAETNSRPRVCTTFVTGFRPSPTKPASRFTASLWRSGIRRSTSRRPRICTCSMLRSVTAPSGSTRSWRPPSLRPTRISVRLRDHYLTNWGHVSRKPAWNKAETGCGGRV